MDKLDELRRDLTDDLRVMLGPRDGKEAQRRHRDLAVLIHRTARLVYPNSHGDQATWIDYLDRWWPNMTEERARDLWTEWRKHLLKDGHPGKFVICHGHREWHWKPQPPGNRIALNLEDLWDEYEQSLDKLVSECRHDPDLRGHVLTTYEKRKIRDWSPDPYGSGTYGFALRQVSGAASISGTISPEDLGETRS